MTETALLLVVTAALAGGGRVAGSSNGLFVFGLPDESGGNR